MNRPKALDLFACEGGATVGYQRAGYDVYAVDMDHSRLKRNPAEHKLVGDALKVLDDLYVMGRVFFDDGSSLELTDIDLIHMSPPCQAFTRGNAGRETSWPKLIEPCREKAAMLDLPYVIENVKDAGPEMVDPVGLCGCMFGLSTIDTDGVRIHLQRLRLFETNWNLQPPRPCDHSTHEWVAGAYGGARRDKYEAKYVRKGGYVPREKAVVKRLLGIEHDVTWNGAFECIPPAYAEWVGLNARVQLIKEAA
ncbi:DNA cytosine methyltransferase [Oerskovia enterophila]|uniref:hypothetical protein n=1 Tax=Oerskovia enterophila TaxID=43678 RepID=UPI00383075F1